MNRACEVPVYLLDEWRAVMRGKLPQPSADYLVICFPNQEIAEQYLADISEWPEEEIRSVLRTMLGSTHDVPPWDRLYLRIMKGRRAAAGTDEPFTEHERRLILRYSGRSSDPVWEGLTWIIDALPDWPRKALDAVDAYFHAMYRHLPDLRINSLGDAMSIIRHRYILEGGARADAKLRLAGFSSRHPGSRLGVRRRQPVGHCSRETGTVSCFLMGRGWFGSSMSTSALIGISGRMESSHGIAEPSLADIRAAPCAVRTSLLTTRAGRFSHDCGYVRCPSRNLRICHRSASARSSCAAAPDFGKGYSDRVLGSRGWGAFTAA